MIAAQPFGSWVDVLTLTEPMHPLPLVNDPRRLSTISPFIIPHALGGTLCGWVSSCHPCSQFATLPSGGTHYTDHHAACGQGNCRAHNEHPRNICRRRRPFKGSDEPPVVDPSNQKPNPKCVPRGTCIIHSGCPRFLISTDTLCTILHKLAIDAFMFSNLYQFKTITVSFK